MNERLSKAISEIEIKIYIHEKFQFFSVCSLTHFYDKEDARIEKLGGRDGGSKGREGGRKR